MRGGEEVVVDNCYATGKAWAQYESLGGSERGSRFGLGQLFKGKTVRRMADNSPYFLYEEGRFRYVFCVSHSADIVNGHARFALVTVNPRHRGSDHAKEE